MTLFWSKMSKAELEHSCTGILETGKHVMKQEGCLQQLYFGLSYSNVLKPILIDGISVGIHGKDQLASVLKTLAPKFKAVGFMNEAWVLPDRAMKRNEVLWVDMQSSQGKYSLFSQICRTNDARIAFGKDVGYWFDTSATCTDRFASGRFMQFYPHVN